MLPSAVTVHCTAVYVGHKEEWISGLLVTSAVLVGILITLALTLSAYKVHKLSSLVALEEPQNYLKFGTLYGRFTVKYRLFRSFELLLSVIAPCLLLLPDKSVSQICGLVLYTVWLLSVVVCWPHWHRTLQVMMSFVSCLRLAGYCCSIYSTDPWSPIIVQVFVLLVSFSAVVIQQRPSFNRVHPYDVEEREKAMKKLNKVEPIQQKGSVDEEESEKQALNTERNHQEHPQAENTRPGQNEGGAEEQLP
eukprot:CAMPEP_0175146096 /NCGR_PEP_ID=MMETSP0087-20121206/15177_1 /TAXON_ID=136419 /ORGANISM="Unknown Unknown, Strain D1" /LENGTH=248 /DNA_ID=CAMNT_0016430997 /DNA_START=87 /DNA_END=833 /DNA_ORIENTATION=-